MSFQLKSQSGLFRKQRVAAAGQRPCRVAVTARAFQATRDPTGGARDANASRRSLLLSGMSVLGLSLLPVGRVQAAESSVQQGLDEYAALEAAGKLNTAKALEAIRAKYSFKRNPDGRVYLKSKKGTFFAVRLDMEVPGALLFRDTSNGQVYALQTEALQQIDLSSDQVVIFMLGDGEWESQLGPITIEDENGQTKTLTLSEVEFRNVVGLISRASDEDAGGDK